MECSKHDTVIEEISKIKERLSKNEQTVNDGWKVIRKNESRIDVLEKTSASIEEQTKGIFRMLKEMTSAIKGIDDKLDMYIKDVRNEIKEHERIINDLDKKLSLNDYKTKDMQNFISNLTFGRMAGLALLIISILSGVKTIMG